MKALTHQQEEARILINLVHPKTQYILRTDLEFVSVNAWIKILSCLNIELLVFTNAQKIIGVVLLILGQEESMDLAEVRYLTVHSDWQNQGIGDKLLKAAEQRAREHYQKKLISLTTVYHPDCPQEGLVSWYIKRGYQLEKEELMPTDIQQQAWKPEFQKLARFKSLRKKL